MEEKSLLHVKKPVHFTSRTSDTNCYICPVASSQPPPQPLITEADEEIQDCATNTVDVDNVGTSFSIVTQLVLDSRETLQDDARALPVTLNLQTASSPLPPARESIWRYFSSPPYISLQLAPSAPHLAPFASLQLASSDPHSLLFTAALRSGAATVTLAPLPSFTLRQCSSSPLSSTSEPIMGLSTCSAASSRIRCTVSPRTFISILPRSTHLHSELGSPAPPGRVLPCHPRNLVALPICHPLQSLTSEDHLASYSYATPLPV
ncbi:hypothetical protein E2C01_033471 [Portunus trituberculatus]|uniref:Uncharacterized protein n=1 Tax=Portunus trituberculatus TaxID=210409 RepID=A0A5B7F306_PORTR|nr:hypothetical protein [Portunus trituberculatus]